MVAIIISIITFILLFLTILLKPTISIKIKNKDVLFETFWVFPLISAFLLIITKQLPFDYLIENFTQNNSINPIKIVILLMSISCLSISLDELGFFNYIATLAVKKTKKNQFRLFFIIFFLVAILTMFTSNDIVILTFTIFICHFAKHAKINPIPYLVMEFVTANTCSMFFIIGNPTNIYLGSTFDISFLEYFSIMVIPTLFGVIASIIVLLLLFYKDLKKPMDTNEIEIEKIKNKPLTIISIIHLAVCTTMLVISNYVNLEMWLITLICALSLTLVLFTYGLIKHNETYLIHTYKRIPWNLAIFVFSMFTIILSLTYNDVFYKIFRLFEKISKDNNFLTILIYGLSSSIIDNLVNNIPMSLGFSFILSNAYYLSSAITPLYPALFATIIGSNIGAFLTPIGALAGIMWMRILKKENIKFSFFDFTKKGLLLTTSILIASLLGLAIII